MSFDFENIEVGSGSPGPASEVQMGAGVTGTVATAHGIAGEDFGVASGASGHGSATAGVCGVHDYELEKDQRVCRLLSGSSSSPTATGSSLGMRK